MPAGDESAEARWDVFVSYTAADTAWAEWIAWQLEAAGHRVLIQAWDFVPGVNWQQRMEEDVARASRTIVVLSHSYLTSVYGQQEWRVAVAADPAGPSRRLLPVRVEDVVRPGLLAQIVSLDLFDRTADEARKALLMTVSGRGKPAAAPAFPGPRLHVESAPSFPGILHSAENDEEATAAPLGPGGKKRPQTGLATGDVVRILANFYPTEDSARHLLQRAGFPDKLIPSPPTSSQFWTAVAESISYGAFIGGMERLLEIAASDFPGSAAFSPKAPEMRSPSPQRLSPAWADKTDVRRRNHRVMLASFQIGVTLGSLMVLTLWLLLESGSTSGTTSDTALLTVALSLIVTSAIVAAAALSSRHIIARAPRFLRRGEPGRFTSGGAAARNTRASKDALEKNYVAILIRRAANIGRAAIAALGMTPPAKPTDRVVHAEIEARWTNLAHRLYTQLPTPEQPPPTTITHGDPT